MKSFRLQEVAPEDWISGKTQSFKLLFLVKYYVTDESVIKNVTTRELLYWQIRRDILADRLDCSEVDSILFAAIALQTEYGDYSPQKIKHIQVTKSSHPGTKEFANLIRS